MAIPPRPFLPGAPVLAPPASTPVAAPTLTQPGAPAFGALPPGGTPLLGANTNPHFLRWLRMQQLRHPNIGGTPAPAAAPTAAPAAAPQSGLLPMLSEIAAQPVLPPAAAPAGFQAPAGKLGFAPSPPQQMFRFGPPSVSRDQYPFLTSLIEKGSLGGTAPPPNFRLIGGNA